jgi:putative ATP-binding cassette transporter
MAYAAISTWLTHVVGRRLVPLNFDRLRYEADFRYGLVRFREDSAAEATAPTGVAEKRAAVDRFQNIVRNWWDVIAAQRWLTIVTGALRQVSGLVPVVVAAPGFFAGLITLGTVAQIRYAYGQVAGALSWFVYAYQEIARWRANVERLSTFAEVMDVAAPNSARRSSPE